MLPPQPPIAAVPFIGFVPDMLPQNVSPPDIVPASVSGSSTSKRIMFELIHVPQSVRRVHLLNS